MEHENLPSFFFSTSPTMLLLMLLLSSWPLLVILINSSWKEKLIHVFNTNTAKSCFQPDKTLWHTRIAFCWFLDVNLDSEINFIYNWKFSDASLETHLKMIKRAPISNNHKHVPVSVSSHIRTVKGDSRTGKPWLCDVGNEAGGVTLFGDELDVNDDDAEGEGEGGGLGDSDMEGVWRPPSGGGVVSAESSPRISGVPELSRVLLDKTSSWLRSSELWEFRQRISS